MSSMLNIITMHQSEELRDQLEEEYWAERRRKDALAAQYTDLLQQLADADPNWSPWWDEHVTGTPEWRGAEIIKARLEVLRKDPDEPMKSAVHYNCTLAPSMRVCEVCRFNPSNTQPSDGQVFL